MFFILSIAVSCVLSGSAAYFLLRFMGSARKRTVALVAGLLPIILLVLGLSVWEYVARMEYDRSGNHDGYMGPLLLLLYGFPVVVGILISGLVVAFWITRKP